MLIKIAIFLSTALFCSQILAVKSEDDSTRKGKFLGITGYLSGSADFHVVPFLKQWNALLQVNIEKNKHKHNGIYFLPASSLYYPPYENPYGFYYPPNFGAGLIHANTLHRPMPLLFDDYNSNNKTPTTTLATPIKPNPADKPKFDIDTNDLDGPSKKSDKNVGFFNLNVRDDRKTHKRDIVHKTKTDDEVVATVVEITDESTTVVPTSEPIIDTTTTTATEPSESQTTEKVPETIESTTSSVPSSTTEIPIASLVDPGFQPINFYYGGTPNENANYIYLTTPEPFLEIESPTEIPNTIHDRYDWGEFRPSIQYEYRNYRFIPDNHFVPVVGKKSSLK